MINFILNLWHIITGDIKVVVRWITSAVAAVYSYFDNLYHILWGEIVGAYHAVANLAREAWHYIAVVYDFARSIVDVVIHNIIVWVMRITNDIAHYAEDVYHFVLKWIELIIHYIDVGIMDALHWVLKNIWDPLYNFVMGIIHWIEHEGAYLWDLITHPQKLAKILGVWLWHAYLSLIKSAARPIAKWLLHTMLSLAGEFADVLETIISALL